MSLDRFILKSLLHVEQPWAVQDYIFDPRRRRLEVVVGREQARGWFGLGRQREEATEERTWRHVNMSGWQTHVRLRVPSGCELPETPWSGDAHHPFTRGLAQRVFVLFNEGLTLRSICTVLELPIDEVWKYRFALDSGKASANSPPPELSSSAAATHSPGLAPTASASALASVSANNSQRVLQEDTVHHEGIPDLSEPVWLALIEGSIQLDIRMLSLKLLLTKIRTQLEVIRDDEVRMMKLREVHRYFVKNERTLAHELEQLRKH